MGRPQLARGTWGEITVKQLDARKFEARCRYRDLNGVESRPSATGPSKTAARDNLRARLSQKKDAAQAGAEPGREDRFGKALDMWAVELEHRERHGEIASGTVRTYLTYLNAHVRPALGNLLVREVTAGVVDKLVTKKRDALGYDSTKTIRTIISGVCEVAVRHGAMDTNPARSIRRLSRGTAARTGVKAMNLDQIHRMWDSLAEFADQKERDAAGKRIGKRVAVWRDLPEVSEAMLSTGVRIGELLAVTDDKVTRAEDGRVTVLVDGRIIRKIGVGLVRVPGRKGNKPPVELTVPEWSARMWLRRKMAAGLGPMFASTSGGWLDPSNTINRLREALSAAGFDWVTSHVWRHTVATLLDRAGLTLSQIADQLGNTPQVTESNYRRSRSKNDAAAGALESIKREA